jgi:hypothetical protein
MEITFQSQADVPLLDNADQSIVVDGMPLLLKRGATPNQCVLYFYQYFTKMINVSSKGIAITE